MHQTVTVQCPHALAFELFTEGMGTWWPIDSYSRAVSEFQNTDVKAVRLEFQARLGGAILEHMSDGRVLPWAEVVAWDPPRRVALEWRPHSMPEPPTEVEVRFVARGRDTLVKLDHRGWDRLSEDFRAELYGLYDRGWPTTLELFAAAARRPT